MANRKKTRGPKIDKYQTGSDKAKAERDALNKRWEPRQSELNRTNRSARLMADALGSAKEHECIFADWECELLHGSDSSAENLITDIFAAPSKIQHCKYCGKTAEACKNDSQGVGCVYQLACGEYHRPWDDQDPESYIIPTDEERYILV